MYVFDHPCTLLSAGSLVNCGLGWDAAVCRVSRGLPLQACELQLQKLLALKASSSQLDAWRCVTPTSVGGGTTGSRAVIAGPGYLE